MNYRNNSFRSSSISCNSLLGSPNISGNHSQVGSARYQHSNYYYPQPTLHSQERFLNRTIRNCPSHIPQKQQTRWLKTGQKARENYRLVSTLNHFHWQESSYDLPIHIHHQTSESIIRWAIERISNVQLYTIDTESDRPTPQRPYSIPALIQIQAIHSTHHATVFLIEVQHLPDTHTSLFHSIQQLCQIIFSPLNRLMVWGDVINELRPFQQFDLFDISTLTNTLNLQEYFTTQWNSAHPHTHDCLSRHQPLVNDSDSKDYLICLINTNDLNDDFDSFHPMNDYSTCICPDTIRPYKIKNAIWSLQKAIQFVFHQALDKSITLNIWSCGLDLCLNTWCSQEDKRTRQSLILYAINDVFAPTHLYFHFNKSDILPKKSITSIGLNNIQPVITTDLPTFLVLADSHGKHLDHYISTSRYNIISRAISGLQWVQNHNNQLCTRSLIVSPLISSLLTSSAGVLFLIGTNSIRTTPALRIIDQIEDIIDLLRSHHPHLMNKHNISIVATFPCNKISSLFPSISSLTENLLTYNEHLKELSIRMNFSLVDFQINTNHLSTDGMHLDNQYKNIISKAIQDYFEISIHKPYQSKRRSRIAIKRRNKKRHQKLREKQKKFTIVRSIDRVWELQYLKDYLKHKDINYARLPEIHRHQLRIQFYNSIDRDNADRILPTNALDSKNYFQWLSHQSS